MGLYRTLFAIARKIWVNWHPPGIAERGQKDGHPRDRRTRVKETENGTPPGLQNEGKN